MKLSIKCLQEREIENHMMIHLSRKHRLATMKSIDIDIPLQEGCFRIIFEESNVEFILTQCSVHNKTLNIQTLNLP